MRKLIFTVLLAMAAVMANAQTVDDGLKALDKKDFAKAKDIADKLTADPNSKNAEGWLFKAQVYNDLAMDDKFKTQVPDAYEQAFEAYKKAYALDPNDKRLLLDFYKSPFVSYEGVTKKASAAYQANDLATAFDNYKKVIDYGNYLNSKNLSYNGYSVPKIDTGMIFMAGYTAMKTNKNDEAMNYFGKLADARINSEADYVIPYQFLAYEYKSKKDEANFKKYVDLGRQMYPKDIYFVTIQLDWARENKNTKDLFAGYDQLLALQPDSLNNNLAYASEMFNYLFKEADTKPADEDVLVGKIETNLKKTLAANYEVLNSNLIMAQMYYNIGLDLATEADKLKASTKPDDVKKRNDLKARAIAKYDMAIPYAEKVAAFYEAKPMADLKPIEKATLKNMYIILNDIYVLKADKVKADLYDKKYAAVK